MNTKHRYHDAKLKNGWNQVFKQCLINYKPNYQIKFLKIENGIKKIISFSVLEIKKNYEIK